MCGITGFLAVGERGALPMETLAHMRDAMSHRGPDGAGLWRTADGRVGFGHRRLAIIDLSDCAAQPFVSDDGRVVICFNGEIYNHADLRREIEREELRAGSARPWRTDHSDTEVIVRAYERWGIDCLERFRGMFGLAVWDGRARCLWLVRDRIGVKPLYWAMVGEGESRRLIFASEIKALLVDPALPRRVHLEALSDALAFLATPAPQTLFDGVKKLAGGTLMRIAHDGTITERRWWEAWQNVEPLTGVSDDEIAARLLETLRESVALRTVSDVPVGIFLSGGIDSSANAALFAELVRARGGTLKTFTIGYRGSSTYFNETRQAARFARRLGAEHHELLLTADDLVDFAPRMIELQDEPIADPVCFPVHFVSRLAREHGVIVAQVGEGSDELFWGYDSWRTWTRLAALNTRLEEWVGARASRVRSGIGRVLSTLGRGNGMATELLERANLHQPIFRSGAEGFGEHRQRELLAPQVLAALNGRTPWEALRPIRERFEAQAWERSALNWMTFSDLSLRLPELLLMRVDKMSMGVSLEGRVPFLDHRLVELALGIPTAVKMRGGVRKAILKRAVRGVLPRSVIHRRKRGFGVPVHEWFRDRLGAEIRAVTLRFAERSGLVRREAVERLLDSGDGTRSWHLYNVAAWWERWIG